MSHNSQQAVCPQRSCGETPCQVVACVYGDGTVVRMGNVRMGQCIPVSFYAAFPPVAAGGSFRNVCQVCGKLRRGKELLIRQPA